jgi:ketosteroid isomerase-like protein
MSEQANIKIVNELFAAFSRVDIPAALALMSDDVDWCNIGPAALGYTGMRRGKEQVRQFFEQVEVFFSHDEFEPQEFITGGESVVVIGRERVTARRTGRSIVNPWCMIFTFRDGRIARWRCFEDTAAVLAAMQPT